MVPRRDLRLTPAELAAERQASADLPSGELRTALHRTADLVADYLESVGERPVLPPIEPGAVRALLPGAPPERGEPLERILDDYQRIVEPNTTHWNHPGFLAYFGITGSAPGIVGETLAAALNVNAMLWRTGPAATELGELACDWLRQMIGLPPEFRGHINDTASVSTFLALAVARHRAPFGVRERGLAGRSEVPPLVVYASDQAHSSVDKAALALGLGTSNVRRLESDAEFRLVPAALQRAVAADRRAGRFPLAVVATAGTTSTTSVDPIAAIADLTAHEGLWLHVDAAYGGAAAICPELRARFAGLERADSVVVNPHKWLFVPVDCSVLWVRDPGLLRAAFSLVPDYLQTGDPATNLMDYGIQLGRRFRALKLWMVIRAFGVDGLRERIRAHCAMARRLADWIAADPGFELVAPVPFSTVCFRARPAPGARPEAADALNERLLAEVNASGLCLLSQTRLRGRYVLRVAIGNLRTGEIRLRRVWELLQETAHRLRDHDREACR